MKFLNPLKISLSTQATQAALAAFSTSKAVLGAYASIWLNKKSLCSSRNSCPFMSVSNFLPVSLSCRGLFFIEKIDAASLCFIANSVFMATTSFFIDWMSSFMSLMSLPCDSQAALHVRLSTSSMRREKRPTPKALLIINQTPPSIVATTPTYAVISDV